MGNTTSCSTSICKGFNYCLVAKIIVAIPAVPMIAAVVASFFSTPLWQFTVAAYSGAAIILVAQKIDRIPALTRLVFPRKSK